MKPAKSNSKTIPSTLDIPDVPPIKKLFANNNSASAAINEVGISFQTVDF